MKLSRRAFLASGAAFTLPLGPARAGDFTPGDTLDAILQRGTIRVGVYRDFAPYSYEENGELKGTDVEIARLIGEGLKIKALPELRNAAEDVDADLRGHVWKGPVEGTVVNVMLHMPIAHGLSARNDMVVMGAPYSGEKTVLCWNKDALSNVKDVEAFRDHKITVNINSLADNYLMSYDGGKLINSVVHQRTLEEAVAGMIRGEAVATMGPINEIEWAFRKFPDKRPQFVMGTEVPPHLKQGYWAYGIAVRVNYHDLFYAVEQVINDALADGRIKAIYEKYGLTFTPAPVEE